MDPTNAKATILLHAGFVVDEEKPGLVGRLRPFQGLDEADFSEVMQAIVALHPGIACSSMVDREAVAAAWWICVCIRTLALNDDSAIKRNRLASAATLSRLAAWATVIESVANRSLQGQNLTESVFHFVEYLAGDQCESPDAHRHFAYLIASCAESDDIDHREAAVRAMSVLRNSPTR